MICSENVSADAENVDNVKLWRFLGTVMLLQRELRWKKTCIINYCAEKVCPGRYISRVFENEINPFYHSRLSPTVVCALKKLREHKQAMCQILTW